MLEIPILHFPPTLVERSGGLTIIADQLRPLFDSAEFYLDGVSLVGHTTRVSTSGLLCLGW